MDAGILSIDFSLISKCEDSDPLSLSTGYIPGDFKKPVSVSAKNNNVLNVLTVSDYEILLELNDKNFYCSIISLLL